jgi:hypothetical protein
MQQDIASFALDPAQANAPRRTMGLLAPPYQLGSSAQNQAVTGADMNLLHQQLLLQAHLRREQEVQREQLLLTQMQRAGYNSGSFSGVPPMNANPVTSMNLLRQAPSSYQNLLLRQRTDGPQYSQLRNGDILSLLRARDLAILEGDTNRLVQIQNILKSLQRNSLQQGLTPLEVQLLDSASITGMQDRPDLFGFNVQGLNSMDTSDRAVNPGNPHGRLSAALGSPAAATCEQKEDETHPDSDKKPSRKRKPSESD